jgi:hypothetical protein
MEDRLRLFVQAWPEDDPRECRAMLAEYAGYRELVGLVTYVGGVAATGPRYRMGDIGGRNDMDGSVRCRS